MKYLIVLGDGMADKNIPELDNRTPLDLSLIHISFMQKCRIQ